MNDESWKGLEKKKEKRERNNVEVGKKGVIVVGVEVMIVNVDVDIAAVPVAVVAALVVVVVADTVIVTGIVIVIVVEANHVIEAVVRIKVKKK